MKTKTIFMILLMTIFMSSVTYASEFRVAMHEGEERDYYFIDSILEEEFVEDAITRKIAFSMKESEPEPKTYTVKEGDNLYRIALNHEITLETIMSLNNLSSIIIHPGDELIVDGEERPKPVLLVADASIGIQSVSSEVEEAFIEEKIEENVEEKVEVPIEMSTPEPEPEAGEEMVVTATAYTAYCEGCSGTTAYGIDLRANPDQKVIAVDPNLIPLGTKVWVENYGVAIAGDTGGAIKGNKIDVFIPTYEQAMQWGRKQVKIKILE